MARPRSPKQQSADEADREVGKAFESVQQELEQLSPEGAARATGAAVLGRAGFSRLSAIAPEALEERAKEAVETVAEAVK
jgi:hypothetical protein